MDGRKNIKTRKQEGQEGRVKDADIPKEEMKERAGWKQLCILPAALVYYEMAFHFIVFRGINWNILYPILFAMAVGLLATVVICAFPPKVNRGMAAVILFACFLWYSTQVVFFHIFKTFLSVYSIGANGADVVEFYDQAIRAIISQAVPILLFAMPFVGVIAFSKFLRISFPKRRPFVLGFYGTGGIFLYSLTLLFLQVPGKEACTPYDLYHENFVIELSMEKLGVIASLRKDVVQILAKGKDDGLDDIIFAELPHSAGKDQQGADVPDLTPEGDSFGNDPKENEPGTLPPDQPPGGQTSPNPSGMPGGQTSPNPSGMPGQPSDGQASPSQTPTPVPVDTSPNVLDIDFVSLAEGEKNSTLQKLHTYFANVAPTPKNEYTGMFQGYNLIMLTAEGYSRWAVNEEITPTLYKMVHEGFYFENYYTPLWWTSTSDGEFVECTGLIPTGTNSFTKTAKHYMPFGFGWIFKKLGYSARAYHNHTYTYYHRDQTHPNMGYDYKGAKGGGLQVKTTWPESDLEMMQVTIPEYIGDERFHTYYMTVSGHMEYTFSGNSMARKNKQYVEHLALSEEAKAYLACQKELDLALEHLLAQLEEAGVAERTVIVLSGDHYPYGLEKSKIDELAGHEVEENFELYESNLVLYVPGMKPVTVRKPSQALDIVPTLLNLFGIEYDSRLFMGQDIFSTSAPLVMFSNQSYITDKVMYNSKTGEVTKLTAEELPEDYVKTVSSIVKNKFNISAAIIKNDYYATLKPYLGTVTNR